MDNMKKINVCYRQGEGQSGLFKIDQLYGVLTQDNDIHANGSVEVIGNDCGDIKTIRIYGNICNKDGAILHVLNGWKDYPVSKGMYKSFSLYCSTIERYFDPEEISYIELYLSFNEENS